MEYKCKNTTHIPLTFVNKPYSTINQPPVGTLVQYDEYAGVFQVYFPGVQGYAPMDCGIFWEYFEGLDDETS